jgi:hypothetical protein
MQVVFCGPRENAATATAVQGTDAAVRGTDAAVRGTDAALRGIDAAGEKCRTLFISFHSMLESSNKVGRMFLQLQLIAVPKARIRILLFWDIFEEFPVSE